MLTRSLPRAKQKFVSEFQETVLQASWAGRGRCAEFEAPLPAYAIRRVEASAGHHVHTLRNLRGGLGVTRVPTATLGKLLPDPISNILNGTMPNKTIQVQGKNQRRWSEDSVGGPVPGLMAGPSLLVSACTIHFNETVNAPKTTRPQLDRTGNSIQ